MELKELLRSVPDYESKTDQEIADELNAQITTPNNETWTAEKLCASLPQDANKIIADMENAGNVAALFKPAFLAFSVYGLELGSPQRQAMIDMLASISQWDEALTERVKSLGKNTTTLRAQHGINTPVTAGDAAAARNQLAVDIAKQEAKAEATARWNAWCVAIDAYDGSGEMPVL